MIRLVFWDTWEDRWWTCMDVAAIILLAATLIFDLGDYFLGVSMGCFLTLISWTFTRMRAKAREHKQWMEEMEHRHQQHLARLRGTWPDDF